MKKIALIKNAAASLAVLFLLFAFLEGSAFLLGWPPGSSDYMEARVIRNDLTPVKEKNEIRIFAFGESTMHGAHYVPYSSPARWLEAYLQDFLPGKKIRVINFARLGHGIAFTHETFQSSLHYQPDIAVFYNGHNEFLPGQRWDYLQREAATLKHRLRTLFLKSRFIAAAYRLLIAHRVRRDDASFKDFMGNLVIETAPRTTLLDPINVIRRDDPLFQQSLDHFRYQLLKILKLGEEHGVKLLFLKPVSNLKDFAPMLSIHHKNLSETELAAWNESFHKGVNFQEKGEDDQALAAFKQAAEIDPDYSELSFRMARIYFKRENFEEAKRLFVKAKDDDGIPSRAVDRLLNVYTELEEKGKLQLMDSEAALISETPSGIMGLPVIEDNVHFSLKGHALIGRQMAKEIAERHWITGEVWQWERERSYEQMVEDLGVTRDLLISAYIKVADYFSSRYEERLHYAREAVGLAPSDPLAIRSLAWAYWVAGQKESAAQTYAALKTLDPSAFQDILSRQKEIAAYMDAR